jgi:hypothetical protein
MALPFENAPVTIDGMRVLFDTKVALFPIELDKGPGDPRPSARRGGGTRSGRSPREEPR